MNLFHRELGQGEPFIILHGLFGNSDNWLTLAKEYAQHFRVIIVDLRNHGASPHSDLFTQEAMAADLCILCEKLSLKAPSVLGHSMGGKVAMQLSKMIQLKKLIVADIGVKYFPVHHQRILEGLNQMDFDKVKSRADADTSLSPFVPNDPERQFLLKNLKRNVDGFQWKINLPIITTQIANIGQEVLTGVPNATRTLFIYGGASNYVLEEDIPKIKEVFSNSIFEKIDGAGHWLHAEQPKEFFSKTIDFLLNHEV